VGCVPKKIMVNAAEYSGFLDDAPAFGWTVVKGEHSLAKLAEARDSEVQRLSGIYRQLLANAGCEVFEARATLEGPHEVRVGERVVTAGRIVIAVGGKPVKPEIPGAELGMTSDDLFHLRRTPRRMVVVGSGYIALEFAGVFRGLGAEIDLVYRSNLPLRHFDQDLREAVKDSLDHLDIRQHTGQELASLERRGSALVARTTTAPRSRPMPCCSPPGACRTSPASASTRPACPCHRERRDRRGRGARDDAEEHLRHRRRHEPAQLTPMAPAVGHALADTLFGNKSEAREPT
jgi:glutathione reductase (NADPH)